MKLKMCKGRTAEKVVNFCCYKMYKYYPPRLGKFYCIMGNESIYPVWRELGALKEGQNIRKSNNESTKIVI